MADLEGRRAARWTFLTSHARVLLEIARNPDVRLREVAATAGITERAAQAIVADLEAAGCITRTRIGRRNRYTVHADSRFRHPAEAGVPISGLLSLFLERDTLDREVERETPGEEPQGSDTQSDPTPSQSLAPVLSPRSEPDLRAVGDQCQAS
ncbi:hypothetical protein AQ490_15770 [Wenjunlia vitaminophila]|uniref:HTH marR-type domain-containing protein n=1 Tax=Wenjunlia vitaminophila TaxID=76728 RepID=A0A0T6LWK9_WENVI|nr:helix-turn-helix domain-containing protein [Wenjunlia vitaminophila]KRV50531.1 hypothetical protein AQ490_15770 [Wenjunlia vitaminophila]